MTIPSRLRQMAVVASRVVDCAMLKLTLPTCLDYWLTAAITRVGAGEFPFEIRHRRQLGCIALLARLLEHWSRATAIESAFSNQRAKQNVPYSRANLNPAIAGLTVQQRFPRLPESRLGFRSKGGELGLRPFRPLRTERLVRWFSQTRHHSPPAKQSTRRPLHVTAAPSRATHPC